MIKRIQCVFYSLFFATSLSAHPIKIYFWHAMAGQPGVGLQHIVDGFNQSQHQYQVIAVYKGDYNATMTSLVAAYRAKQQPALCQIFEIGTATMMGAAQAIVPVYQLMQQYHHPIAATDFLAPIAGYYSDAQNHLVSMPFNASSAVLFYNKTAFKQAGLNPDQPPKTWPQVEEMGKRLLKSGQACVYTTAWPAWIQLEELSAWHNIPYASSDNGFASFNVSVLYNNSLIARQIQTLLHWQKSGIFEYGGRGDNADALFTSGHCAMLTQSSGARAGLMTDSKFAVGVAPLPYWPDVNDAPQNTIIGGASIWVMQGFSAQVYAGVADFFAYMMQPNVQLQWQRDTGYLPLTQAAYALTQQSGFYQQNPGSDVAIKSLLNKPPTVYSKGIRLGNFMQIREVNDTALEAVFSKQMSVKQALSYAQTHANALLKRFAELND